MKKIIILGLLFVLTGCNNKSGTIICTLNTNDEVNGYNMNSEYKINYTGDYVDSVETLEEVISESKAFLDTFEMTTNDIYSKANDEYGGYTYTITNKNNKLSLKVMIDYSKIDIEKYVLKEQELKPFIEDGKFLVDGIKSIYESKGATCK